MWGLLAVFLLAASAPAAADVTIDAANFPDAVFRGHVTANWDSDHDGTLSDAEIAAVDSADVSNKDIQSLKGIEHFTALKELICIDNQLTSLDVSKNKHLKSLNCQKTASRSSIWEGLASWFRPVSMWAGRRGTA